MEELGDSLNAYRDNDHDTVATISQTVSEAIYSTKPKSTHGFQTSREQNWKWIKGSSS